MIIELLFWKQVFQVRYRRQSSSETFRKGPRKSILRQENFEPHFLSLNSVQTSVVVPFCYRLSVERFRRLRYLTIYDFRQVHLESVENVMLSQVKTFDRLFHWNFAFYQSQYNIENCFLW